jgi:hypothetical protein
MFRPTVSLRVTKTLLLDWANAEFPTYYRMISTHRSCNEDFLSSCAGLRRMYPHDPFPRIESFPTVASFGSRVQDRRLNELKAGISLTLREPVGEDPQILHGVATVLSKRIDCRFFGPDLATRVFCDHFAFHLIFNVLVEEEIDIDEWEDLPD